MALACNALGTSVITLCTGSRDPESMWRRHPDNDLPEAWSDMLVSMEEALNLTEDTGVTLAFEPEVSNVVDSAQKARLLLNIMQSQRLKVVMDGANIFHAGELSQMSTILGEALDLLGPDIVIAHAKDLDHDGEAGNVAAGTGLLDYPPLSLTVAEIGIQWASNLARPQRDTGPGLCGVRQERAFRNLAPPASRRSAMNNPLRIGLIGAGQIGNQHLVGYSKIPEARVVAVADLTAERVDAAKAEYDIPDGYSDYRELLARDDIDAVDVCVHNNKHAPLTIAALKAGKHVYCEKPMAGAYRDAANMLEAARTCGRMLHIQLAMIYTAEARAAKRLIDDGELGNIYYARSFGFRRRGRPFVDGYGSAAFVDAATAAGGALFDMGIYHISQILHLIGNPDVLTVTGSTHQELDMYEERRAFSNYSVEEMALGWVRLKGGVSLNIEETWAAHHDGQESSKILGSRGGIRLDPLTFFTTKSDLPLNATIDAKSADSRWHRCHSDTAWYDSSQNHWVGALLGRVPLLPTAEYALNTALISEGIYLSGSRGLEMTGDEIRQSSQSKAIDPFTPEKVWG